MELEIATTDKNGFGKKQQLALYKNGMLPYVVERVLQDARLGKLPDFPSTPQNVKNFNHPTQLKEHHIKQAAS